jgi:hypothetical protein
MTTESWVHIAATAVSVAAIVGPILLTIYTKISHKVIRLETKVDNVEEILNNGLTDNVKELAGEVAEIRGRCVAYHNLLPPQKERS